MGCQSIVHGRITVNVASYDKAKAFIQNLDENQVFPWLLSEMFNFPDLASPYCYRDSVITFGANYKEVEDDWTLWIIRFEHILSNIDFVTAKVQLETEMYGTYNFFWVNKKRSADRENLVETEKWYFGDGLRSRWGSLEKENLSILTELFNFHYPFEITTAHQELFASFMQAVLEIGLGKNIDFYEDLPKFYYQTMLWPLLIKLSMDKKLHFFTDEERKGPCLRIDHVINEINF